MTRLSSWDQVAPRSYPQVAVCFPFRDNHEDAATECLKVALWKLRQQKPHLGGRIREDRSGIVHHIQTVNDSIPFETNFIRNEFRHSFAELFQLDFPPNAFVGPIFADPEALTQKTEPRPVFYVRALFIRGGLLLCVLFSHIFVDGEGLHMFLEAFSTQTRNESSRHPSNFGIQFDQLFNTHKHAGTSFNQLLAACPEYHILPDLSGPTQWAVQPGGTPIEQITKSGVKFVFNDQKLKELKVLLQSNSAAQKPPSTYTCLAALTWAHVARARLLAEADPAVLTSSEPAKICTPVNWRYRTFDSLTADYYGNAIAVPMTEVPIRDLVRACDDSRVLMEVARRVDATIRAVDEDFVRQRTALIHAAPDPRVIGLNSEPRRPQDLHFNTWRRVGCGTRWNIPGVEPAEEEVPPGRGVKQVAIGRVLPKWNMGAALILPGMTESPVQELLIALPTASMDVLRCDEGWMRWVEKAVE